MSQAKDEPGRRGLDLFFRAHPWHGVSLGPSAPGVVTVYVEIVPTDTVKYEIDKASGILRLDRPQKYSNVCPTLYGFLPRTLCAESVAALSAERAGRQGIVGDGDPMDVCVLAEKPITHGNILVQAIPLGGFRMLDGAEADDKIVAVLEGDAVYGGLQDITECSSLLIDRLRHYFLTYKQAPGDAVSACEITHVYGREEAHAVIRRSQEDYAAHYGDVERRLTEAFSR